MGRKGQTIDCQSFWVRVNQLGRGGLKEAKCRVEAVFDELIHELFENSASINPGLLHPIVIHKRDPKLALQAFFWNRKVKEDVKRRKNKKRKKKKKEKRKNEKMKKKWGF